MKKAVFYKFFRKVGFFFFNVTKSVQIEKKFAYITREIFKRWKVYKTIRFRRIFYYIFVISATIHYAPESHNFAKSLQLLHEIQLLNSLRKVEP